MTAHEISGVRLGDVYRDNNNDLWEVEALVTDPLAIVRNVKTGRKEHHVIGCPNWDAKWNAGPLR